MQTTEHRQLTRPLLAATPRHSPFRIIGLSFENPFRAALLTAIIYLLVALLFYPTTLGQATYSAYYNYLADAFLHGQLHLLTRPPMVRDLTVFQGHYYLYWGPMTAVMLMPFVALFGVHMSDTLFSIGIGALNVFLTAQVLRELVARRLLRISRVQRGALVTVFALGSVHFILAVAARVWFTGLVTGYFWVALAYLVALRLRGWQAFAATGAALGCALLTRTHLPLIGAWPVLYLLVINRREPRLRRFSACVAGVAPLIVALVLSLVYNYARFGSFNENGTSHQLFNPIFTAEIARFGLFNLRYIPANFFYQYLAYPFPWRDESDYGGSLFLLSPVFFGLFLALYSAIVYRRSWPMVAGLLISILPAAFIDLTIIGGGYVQAGPRYTLDFTLPLLMLTAYGIRRWPRWLLALTCAISVAHYALALGV